MPAALQPSLVDVFLSNLDEQPGQHQGPTGRVKTLVNAQSKHFQHASAFNPAKLVLESRDGFASLPQDIYDLSGNLIGTNWTESNLLDSMSDQLVAVDHRIPRVWNGHDYFTEYSDVRILTNKLREDALVGGYGVILVPNSNILGHVEAVCYTLVPSSGVYEVWLGFREAPGAPSSVRRADDLSGPWIVPPFKVLGNLTKAVVAKVRNDGTNFFLIFNDDGTVSTFFNVYVFNIRGKQLTSGQFPRLDTTTWPGWWDVTTDPRSPTLLVHVQPADDTDDPTVDVTTRFTAIWYSSGSLQFFGVTDATAVCNGWCNWLKNKKDTDLYLVNSKPGGASDQQLIVYRIRPFLPPIVTPTDGWQSAGYFLFSTANFSGMTGAALVISNSGAANLDGVYTITSVGGGGTQVNVSPSPPVPGTNHPFLPGTIAVVGRYVRTADSWAVADIGPKIDAITGYVPNIAPLTFFPVVGLLEPENDTGPQFDPQQRKIVTYQVVDGGASTLVRTSVSQALVSQSTNLGDDWFQATFYQSGSGIDPDAASLTPTFTSGDFFAGSQEQTVPNADGDSFTGPETTFAGSTVSFQAIRVTGSAAAQNIDDTGTPDSVAVGVTSVPGYINRDALVWTFKNLAPNTAYVGGLLKITGSSIPTANFSWPILQVSGGTFLTKQVNTVGGTIVPGTFVGNSGAGGTAEVKSRTYYSIASLTDKYDDQTIDFLRFGTMTVTGNSVSANNGAKTIVEAVIAPVLDINSYGLGPAAWITTGSEVSDGGAFTAAMSNFGANSWALNARLFPACLIGGSLVVSDDVKYPQNNTGDIGIEITDATNAAGIGTDSGDTGAMRSQVFSDLPPPKFKIILPDDLLPFTFFVQDLASDLAANAFRFRGALLQFNSTHSPAAGLYRVIGFGPDLDGTLYCERIVQADDLPAYQLVADDSVQIFFTVATQAPFQPTYFLTPATGKRPTIGMFDRLNAFNNWRHQGVNTLFGHLTSINETDSGLSFVAPTAQQRVTEANANSQQVQGTTVGVKHWQIRTDYGNAVDDFIPGTQAVTFEGDSFPEDGFPLAMEAPWLVSVDAAESSPGLQAGGTYVYTAVAKSKDKNGNPIFSPPSPPLVVGPLADGKTQITIGGDLPQPWATNPVPISGVMGVVNRSPVTIVVTRTSYVNGVETVTQYEITDELQPNALAPISADNASGFTFGDTDSNVQWTYTDENPDIVIQVNERLYSQSFLPRFGAGPFSDGEFWNDRYWLISPDGSLQFSTPVTDGIRPSFFPGFRVAPPPNDRPVCVRALQQFLIVLCEKGSFYLPATALPSASLAEIGQVPIPSLVPLPFTNGCTGQAITTPAGVFYSSTAGGIWNITRSLTNDFMSQPMVDTFAAMSDDGRKVLGMAIDRDQRLGISTGEELVIYDFVSGLWSTWNLPDDATQLTTFAGRFAARLPDQISVQSDDPFDSIIDEFPLLAINWRAVLAGISFGSVRAFVRLWRMQIIGQFLGHHTLDVKIEYPDDFPDDPTICPSIVPDGLTPYLIEAIPGHGRASQFVVTLDVNHNGELTPGRSCSIELLSCKVGLQAGQRQVPPGQRI